MKDLVIGCSTNYTWDTLKYWVNSLNRCGFVGDKVLILMNCDKDTVKKVVDAGVSVIGFGGQDGNLTYNSTLPVHVERFLHIYEFLKNHEYRYVITTDVKDVIFQRNPIEFMDRQLKDRHHQLIFSSESIKYKDEPWGNNNLLETFGPYFHKDFKENEIFNVGVLAGHADAMKDLSAMIFNMSLNRPIPIVDQSTFNFIISQEPYKTSCLYTRSESGWACQLGTTGDSSKLNEFYPNLLEAIPFFDRNVVRTSESYEYYIVHQYDRTPWKQIIEEKYKG